MKKFLFVLFLISFSVVNGFEVIPIDDSVVGFEGEVLNFSFKIINDVDRNVSIRFYDFINTNMYELSFSSTVFLRGFEEKEVIFSTLSSVSTPLGITVPLEIYATDGDQTSSFFIKPLYKKSTEIAKPIINNVLLETELDPRFGHVVVVEVFNPIDEILNSKILYQVLKDEVVLFDEELNVYLDPVGVKKVSLNLDLNYYTEPGDYVLRVQAFNGKNSLGWVSKSFTVGGFSEFNVEPVIEQGLFKKSYLINITNTGTSIGEKSFSLSIIPLDRLFGYAVSEGVFVKEDKIFFTTNVFPGQTVTLEYSVDYSPLMLLPIFLYLIYVVYSFFTRKIFVKRSVVKISGDMDELSYKVLIRIKNLSNDKITNFKVVEKVLPMVKNIGSYGVARPRIVKSAGLLRSLVWEYDMLYPGDEIYITYKITTGMGVLGRIILPPTKITFNSKGKKQIHNTRINTLIGADEEF